ncbi:MAG: EAL domain-containing protein, partial [Lysobacter spongiicola]|nr:EAL domain-containing protein [Lysobacter spongiicola]
ALVAALREMGVGVAADDFGSGESSLGVLAGMGFAALKIDRDFVDALDDDPAAAAVVRAVAGIGQAMGQRVVAKGVANEAQYRALVAAGCTGMQGLMFGAAGSASQLDDLLARDAAALAAG